MRQSKDGKKSSYEVDNPRAANANKFQFAEDDDSDDLLGDHDTLDQAQSSIQVRDYTTLEAKAEINDKIKN